MALSLNFELSDRDLEHFQAAQAKAREAAQGRSEQEIIDCAAQLLVDAQKMQIPGFILERLLRLDDLIAMLRDEAWSLEDVDRERVVSALTYFCDPEDVIPDRVEVLGYLDDAIMIELAVRTLAHEIEAYDEFCEFRQRHAERLGIEPGQVGRADWLSGRRDELVDRMHVRRARDMGVGYGSSSGYANPRPSYTRGWRPGMFSFR